MTMILKTNTAVRVTVGPFLDKTDGITPEIALTVTNCLLTLMVDTAGVPTLVLDAAATASGGNNDMVHVTSDAAGYYDLELTAAQLNYLGNAKLAITDAANHCPVFHEIHIVTANVWDSLFSTDVLDVSVVQLLGTAWLTPGTAGTPDVNTKLISGDSVAADNCEADYDGTGYAGGTIVKTADVTKLLGTAWTAPATAGLPDVNVKQISTDATAADNLEAFTDGTGYVGGTLKLGVDAVAISGDTTAADNCEADYDGTGYVGGTIVKQADLKSILGTALTETSAGYLTAAFKKLFDVASPVLTAASVNLVLNDIADAILKRDWNGLTGEAARSMLNALRILRNKWSITTGTLTVTKEDDTTAAWTAAVTGTPDADPITTFDP